MMEHPKPKILVVEDISDWRLTFKSLLGDAGFDVTAVGSLLDAQNLLNVDSYEVALIDIRLDESDVDNDDGLKLAEEISLHWPEMKVIIATGYSTNEYINRAMEPKGLDSKAPAIDLVEKSNVGNLINLIKQAIKK